MLLTAKPHSLRSEEEQQNRLRRQIRDAKRGVPATRPRRIEQDDYIDLTAPAYGSGGRQG